MKRKAEELRSHLDVASTALQAFMESNRVVSFEDEKNNVDARLKSLNQRLIEAEKIRMQAESRYKTAQAILEEGVAIETIPGVQESPRINTIKSELSKLEQYYSDVRDRLGKEHAQIKSLTAQIGALRQQMATEATNIVNSLKGTYEQALAEENMLRDELAKQKEEALRFNQLFLRYNQLKQNRDSLLETYNSLFLQIDNREARQALPSSGDSSTDVVSEATEGVR